MIISECIQFCPFCKSEIKFKVIDNKIICPVCKTQLGIIKGKN